MSKIRKADAADHDAIWAILEPIFRAGDSYAIDPDIPRDAALAFWQGGNHSVYVISEDSTLLGTYYICPNQAGGGNHVCNCGFATAKAARGRGLARKMLDHALKTARESGYYAMQFNFVVASNLAAIQIWRDYGFETVGRLPDAFSHPDQGLIDALILYKTL